MPLRAETGFFGQTLRESCKIISYILYALWVFAIALAYLTGATIGICNAGLMGVEFGLITLVYVGVLKENHWFLLPWLVMVSSASLYIPIGCLGFIFDNHILKTLDESESYTSILTVFCSLGLYISLARYVASYYLTLRELDTTVRNLLPIDEQ